MAATIKLNKSSVSDLLRYMEERHAIYLKRAAGEEKPWTQNPILQQYRFCNVYRELDKVTVWVREHIREVYLDHPNLWFMLCIARQINHTDTLEELMETRGAWPLVGYNATALKRVLRSRKARGEKVYTGAYMLNCNWHPKWSGDRDKATFTADLVLQSTWDAGPPRFTSLEECAEDLSKGHGWGTFMAAQVVADLKHTRHLLHAPDWRDWAASGPGSRRGLNIVCGREVEEPWREAEWLGKIQELKELVNRRWSYQHLCAQDVQNNLCEFSKYVRGSSRSRYDGN